MRRIYIILIMLLSVAAASAQLHGKLGRELQEQCRKGNIERIQASDEALEIQEEYKELIRKVATRNLSKKYSDREALQTMLDSIDSDKITIWEPYTSKGYKILHKQVKRLALRKKTLNGNRTYPVEERYIPQADKKLPHTEILGSIWR